MNVIVQLGLAAHKKAPEKIYKFLSFFPKTIYLNHFDSKSDFFHNSKPKVAEKLQGLALPNSELEIKLNLLTPKDLYRT